MWVRCHNTTTTARQAKVKERHKEWTKVYRWSKIKLWIIHNWKYRSWPQLPRRAMIQKEEALLWIRFCKPMGNWQPVPVDVKSINNNQSRKDLPEIIKAWVVEEQLANCFKEVLQNKWISQHMNLVLEQTWTDHLQDNQALVAWANHQDKMTLEQEGKMLEVELRHQDRVRGMDRIWLLIVLIH